MTFRIRQLIILIFSGLVLQACSDDSGSTPSTPTVSASLTLTLNRSTLRFEDKGFSISIDAQATGPYTITRRGISYSRTRFEKLTPGFFTENGSGNGSFIARLSGIEFAETWFVRPYAITLDANQKSDTTYGSDLSLSSTPAIKEVEARNLSESGFTITSTGLSPNRITGLAPILSKGFCWSLSINPDLNQSGKWVADNTDTTAFSFDLQGLESGKIYYVRAFAINAADTAYSRNFLVGTSTRDIENNVYAVTVIGNQVWMKENLRAKRFQDGSAVNVVSSENWRNSQNQASTYVNNSIYGNYYNRLAITDSRNLCPTGWRIPGKLEWDTLLQNLGGWNTAGLKMKAATSAWGGILTGQGSSQFNAIPSGRIDSTGTVRNQGDIGLWWARQNQSRRTPERVYRIDKFNDEVLSGEVDSLGGYTVRCVRNVK